MLLSLSFPVPVLLHFRRRSALPPTLTPTHLLVGRSHLSKIRFQNRCYLSAPLRRRPCFVQSNWLVVVVALLLTRPIVCDRNHDKSSSAGRQSNDDTHPTSRSLACQVSANASDAWARAGPSRGASTSWLFWPVSRQRFRANAHARRQVLGLIFLPIYLSPTNRRAGKCEPSGGARVSLTSRHATLSCQGLCVCLGGCKCASLARMRACPQQSFRQRTGAAIPSPFSPVYDFIFISIVRR